MLPSAARDSADVDGGESSVRASEEHVELGGATVKWRTQANADWRSLARRNQLREVFKIMEGAEMK